MIKTANSKRRAVRLVLFVMTAALVLPGLAVADHTVCASTGAACPEFTPDFIVNLTTRYTDVSDQVTIDGGQGDHERHNLTTDYYIAKGTQLFPEKVKPGQKVGGSAATSCHEVGSPGFTRAEILAIGIGARLTYTGDPPMTLGMPSGPAPRLTVTYGLSTGGRIAFLNYNGTDTINLCMYMSTGTTITNPGGGPTAVKEFLMPLTLTRLPSTSAYGWKLHIDWTSAISPTDGTAVPGLIRDQVLFNRAASVRYTRIVLDGLTAGNWNGSRVVFAKNPVDPGDAAFAGDFTACTRGMRDPSLGAPICRDDLVSTLTKTQAVQFSVPPEPVFHDFGRMTAPVAGAGTKNYGILYTLLWGKTSIVLTWGAAPVWGDPTHQVAAYEVQLKAAGDNPDTYYRRVAKVGGCGADGSAGSCTTTIDLPVNAGGSVFTPTGVYDVKVWTIYSDGHRTDGRCDDGVTLGGISCSPSMSGFKNVYPGYGFREFAIIERPWPLLFDTGAPGVGQAQPGIGTNPAKWIFGVDYLNQEAMAFRWFAVAPPSIRSGHSNLIRSQDNANGLVSWGDAQIGGNSQRFRFDGFTQGTTLRAKIFIYDLKGLGNGCPPQPCGGMPTSNGTGEDITATKL